MSGKELTDKQQRFIEEYLVDLNATQAAIRVSFNVIPSKWTLYSFLLIRNALTEVYRLLNDEGQFLLIQHGLSPELDVLKGNQVHRYCPE